MPDGSFGEDLGRDQLAAPVVQPANRPALHQHFACRHDLRAPEPPKLAPGKPSGAPTVKRTVVTSNLVFTGVMTGEFQALDGDTGKVLWSFQTPSVIIGQPVTWEKDGKQYVTVMSGLGGVYAQRGGDPNLENLPTGVSLWTFALFDK